MWDILTLVVLLVVGLYGLFPILIRGTLKQNASPRFEHLYLGQLPPEFVKYLEEIWPGLKADGFQIGAYLRQHEDTVTAYLALFVNHTAEDLALAGAWYGKVNGTDQLQTMHLEFSTDFVDGSEVSTNNNTQAGVFARVPQKQVLKFPSVREPRMLYRVHGEMIRKFGQASKAALPAAGEEAAALSQGMVTEYEQQCKAGLLYLDHRTGTYRPTWKGAFLMTWRQLFPLKQLEQARAQHTARAILTSLGRPIH